MRLGGAIFNQYDSPASWVEAVKAEGYSAALCPEVKATDSRDLRAYAEASRQADIVIAEAGAWSNPLSGDDSVRRQAVAYCKERLAVAEEVGARCCVNLSGSRGEKRNAPHIDNLTADTFDLIVQAVREIIDDVKPERTFYTLEMMPWMFPHSADSYLELIGAIDRKSFAVHLDPVNIISSPQRYFSNGALIRECFAKLGRHIKSCHAKDVLLINKPTVHLDEVPPGKGMLDYGCFLKQLDKLDADMPLIMEHMRTREEYAESARYIRSVAGENKVRIK